MPESVKVTDAHVHWFRLRRSGLVTPFAAPEETAAHLLGVQAQLPPAANIAFFNRTSGCTIDALVAARLGHRTLVRFWGPRNTVHIFHAEDWPFLHAVFAERQSIMRQRLEAAGLYGDLRRLVRRIEKRLAAGDVLTYKDVKSKKLEQVQDKWVVSYLVYMELVREGVVCHGEDQGTESGFVHREHWLPHLDWSPPEPSAAQAELAQRYLAAYGPAEPRDLAFWYGTNVTKARRWIDAAGESCRKVDVGGRTLWCRSTDLADIHAKPPPVSRWPVRLLYRFDPLLLATKDKSWLIDDEHYKAVWKGSAHVDPVLLVKGRIAGTWRYDKKARGLLVKVRPFAKLTAAVAGAAKHQAQAIAGFLGLDLAEFDVQP